MRVPSESNRQNPTEEGQDWSQVINSVFSSLAKYTPASLIRSAFASSSLSSKSQEIPEPPDFWDRVSEGVISVFAAMARCVEAVWCWIEEKILSWVVDERKKYAPRLEKWIDRLVSEGSELVQLQREIIGLFRGLHRALQEEIQKRVEEILVLKNREEPFPSTFEEILASEEPESKQILVDVALELQYKYRKI